jgi:protein required for attachment to host cells
MGRSFHSNVRRTICPAHGAVKELQCGNGDAIHPLPHGPIQSERAHMTGVSIDHNAWVMVGDGEKALFFRNEGDKAHPNLEVIDVLQQDNPKTHEQGTDRPGRTHSSVGTHRSAMQETNWHKLEKHRFAKEIADVLYSAAHSGRYSKLILAAPPMTMGDLRKALHKEVADKVVAEVPKDLTNMPPDEIERVLTKTS